MYAQMLNGTAYPLTWAEYERLVTRSAEDPDVVINFPPGAWDMFVRQFLSGTEGDSAFEEDFLSDMTIAG